MGSAAKFWPAKLFGRSKKAKQDGAFVPRTAMAARIVGSNPADQADRSPETPEILFDSFTSPPAMPEEANPASEITMERQADRFVPTRTSTVLTDSRGKQQRARIINISATGVAIEADFRIMPPESVTMVGAKPVTEGRAIRGGQVFLFDKPLDPARCNPQILL